MSDTPTREMTLAEWCARLPDCHLVNRELRALKASAVPEKPQEAEIHPAEIPLAYAAQLRAKLANASEGDVTMSREVLAEIAECLEGANTGRRYNIGVLDKS